MPRVKIIKPGLFTSIQDKGRIGYAYYAIPKSGYAQQSKAESANFLVGNKRESAVIECILIPPTLEFLEDSCLAITGDDFNFKINNKKALHNKTLNVKKGDFLTGTANKNAHTAYLAFQGEIKSEVHYNSQSTYVNAKLGGLKGTLLQKNDILTIQNNNPKNVKREIVENQITTNIQEITFFKGPEFNFLNDKSKELLFTSTYSIGSSSNRMGARLEGQPLTSKHKQLINSVPVLPGFIQLPQSGYPIVVLNDGQTTGGYPRIGYIRNEEIEKVNGIGRSIVFRLNI